MSQGNVNEDYARYIYDSIKSKIKQKPESKSDKPKRNRKDRPRVDYSKSEDEDVDFDIDSNQPKARTVEENSLKNLVKPTNNFGGSTGEFMREERGTVVDGLRPHVNEIKCKK